MNFACNEAEKKDIIGYVFVNGSRDEPARQVNGLESLQSPLFAAGPSLPLRSLCL